MGRRQIRAGLVLAMGLLIILAASAASPAENNPIKYDFTNPPEVFKTTIGESVASAGIDPAELAQIVSAAQVVIVNDHPGNPQIPWMTTSGVLVNAPPELMFEVIKDYPSYAGFMAQVGKSWAEPVTEVIDQVFYELVVQILFLKVTLPYSVYHYYQPPYRIDWVMASGEFTCNYGAYEVIPVPGRPDQCMLFYTSYSQPRNSVIVSLFERVPQLDLMINLSTGTLWVKALQNRAEQLHREKTGAAAESGQKAEILKLINDYPGTMTALLRRGQLVFLEPTTPRYYTGGAIVNQPRDQVFASLADVAGMATISRNNTVEVLERTPNTIRAKIHTVIRLMIDFESEYVMNYTLDPPRRITFEGDQDSPVKSVAGSWELIELTPTQTLVFYRNTSDLTSQGIAMRQLLKIEPAFEYAIQASLTQYMVNDMKRWCEASPEERQKMAAEAAKQK